MPLGFVHPNLSLLVKSLMCTTYCSHREFRCFWLTAQYPANAQLCYLGHMTKLSKIVSIYEANSSLLYIE